MSLLQQMIGDLSGEGFVESHGQFTLDVEAARRRLADFRLADPYQWILKMTQAATLLDCTHIALTTSGNELGLRFEGLRVSLEEFTHGLQALSLEDNSSRRARGLNHLAQAIHALQRRTGKRTVLRAAQPGHSFALEGECLLTRPTDPGWRAEPMVTLVLQRGWTWLQREWPEVEWLRRRSYTAPCKIASNLQLWSKGLQPDRQRSVLFSLMFLPSYYGVQLLVGPSARGHGLSRDRPVIDSPGTGTQLYCCDNLLKTFAAVSRWEFNGEIEAAVSVRHPPLSQGRLQVWLDGVLSEPIVMPGVACDAIIGCQDLTCDLSGLRMVENEALQAKVLWVERALKKLDKILAKARPRSR
ncbi:hypothetical protein IV102_10180 [bacterium]|nr:hypothetical protein [bacterium]